MPMPGSPKSTESEMPAVVPKSCKLKTPPVLLVHTKLDTQRPVFFLADTNIQVKYLGGSFYR